MSSAEGPEKRVGNIAASTYADHPCSDFDNGFVLCQGEIGEERSVAGDGGVCVALDVGTPLPARRVGVSGSDVLGLKPFELLLVAKLIGLGWFARLVPLLSMNGGRRGVLP